MGKTRLKTPKRRPHIPRAPKKAIKKTPTRPQAQRSIEAYFSSSSALESPANPSTVYSKRKIDEYFTPSNASRTLHQISSLSRTTDVVVSSDLDGRYSSNPTEYHQIQSLPRSSPEYSIVSINLYAILIFYKLTLLDELSRE